MGTIVSNPRILIFDSSRYAHSATCLRLLQEYWIEHVSTGQLDIVVWNEFFHSHPDVVELANTAPNKNIRFLAISEGKQEKKNAHDSTTDKTIITSEAHQLKEGTGTYSATWFDWHLFQNYASKLDATIGFIPNINEYLPQLAAGVESSVPITGILFSPTFHDGEWDISDPIAPDGVLPEKRMLVQALQSEALDSLFVLDPYAVRHLNESSSGDKAIYLTDPVEAPQASLQQSMRLNLELEIQGNRRMFLVYGDLSRRKEITQIITALRLLSDTICKKICLTLVGKISSEFRQHLDVEIMSLRSARPIQVVTYYQFMTDNKLGSLFSMSDVVLMPYQTYHGMSNVTLLAAAAGKPVLASKAGLLGNLVEQNKLGMTYDSDSIQQIADAIQNFTEHDPQSFLDPGLSKKLVSQHSPHHFAATLFNRLGVTSNS
ncbi:MAG: hypothetical protein DHS20C01_22650 [marine bacterium B5-7]|nr:MAG: hypothetical protein DHS20C01_22650 [marine bacterium B5-7]